MNEDDVATFIENNPAFFRRKPWLLGSIELPDPHEGQAISLAERQTQILRERIRSLEASLADLTRNGRDNDALGEGLAQWSSALLAERDEARLPQCVVDGLKEVFSVPAAAVRIWEIDPRFSGLECAKPVGADVVRFAASMQAPFCGLNADFAAAGWMRSDEGDIRSLALIPLRNEAAAAPFGLLTLGSADLQRFRSDMGTVFLSRIGQLAAAALSRLRG
ncbi:MAG TPA: DUF484 family protein [Burkholderiaceae bacterium]|jgi:hypothetical protein|nr:DUF484 family protein [Burkholderiaceae bacterium]